MTGSWLGVRILSRTERVDSQVLRTEGTTEDDDRPPTDGSDSHVSFDLGDDSIATRPPCQESLRSPRRSGSSTLCDPSEHPSRLTSLAMGN